MALFRWSRRLTHRIPKHIGRRASPSGAAFGSCASRVWNRYISSALAASARSLNGVPGYMSTIVRRPSLLARATWHRADHAARLGSAVPWWRANRNACCVASSRQLNVAHCQRLDRAPSCRYATPAELLRKIPSLFCALLCGIETLGVASCRGNEQTHNLPGKISIFQDRLRLQRLAGIKLLALQLWMRSSGPRGPSRRRVRHTPRSTARIQG